MNVSERRELARAAFRRGLSNLLLAFGHAPAEWKVDILEEVLADLKKPEGDGPRGDQPPTAPLEERRFDEASTA